MYGPKQFIIHYATVTREKEKKETTQLANQHVFFTLNMTPDVRTYN